jgi:FG-GAP-like repeat
VADNADERDGEREGYSQAPVSRRSFVVGVAAAGAAATAARSWPGGRAVSGVPGARAGRAAATSTCGALSRVKQPAVSGGELTDAACVSASEWWAVGDVGAATRANQTLIERFDGSVWSIVPSPNQGTSNNGLNGVSMIPGAGWAVGYAQMAGTYQPLALQWNGVQWSLASPAAFTSNTLFTDVDTLADGTTWAVGFQTTATGTRSTLIEQESGGAWTQVASPNAPASTDNSLMAVSGAQATGLWTVGYWLSPTGLQPLVLSYDTTQPSPTWVLVSGVPAPGQIDTVLTGVDVLSASDVWAVGYYNDGSADRPLALHWDGTVWANSPIPGAGLLRNVRAVASDNVWAVGSYYSASLQRYQTLVVHFDGTAWTTVVSADTPAADDQLVGLAANPAGSALALVGRAGSKPLIEQASCPSGPVSLPARTEAPVPPVPAAPGVGPAPSPPPPTPPATTAVPVTITDQATAAGISGTPDWSFSAAVADFTGDGWPDLFISHHWHPANLYLNNQDGTFSAADVSFFSSILDRHDCQPADFNQDGRMDMFCSVGADRGTALKCNGLFIQQSDGTFADQAYQWNIGDSTGRGRYCAVLDANNDGYPDVFYGTDPLRPDGLPSINRFYLNTGQGSFIDSPAMGLNLNFGARSARTVDYNNDGWPDLLICGYTGGLRLFENNQGQGFTDVSSILGAPVQALDALMVDVNHDSRPDLIVLTKSAVILRLQNADGTFAPPKTILKVKNGVALAAGDVNGDNNPDIYVVVGRSGGANAADCLLIGNATGGFTAQAIPQTTAGSGEAVFPIDYNRTGLTSFLVLNGEVPYTGPVQLLTPQT